MCDNPSCNYQIPNLAAMFTILDSIRFVDCQCNTCQKLCIRELVADPIANVAMWNENFAFEIDLHKSTYSFV